MHGSGVCGQFCLVVVDHKLADRPSEKAIMEIQIMEDRFINYGSHSKKRLKKIFILFNFMTIHPRIW